MTKPEFGDPTRRKAPEIVTGNAAEDFSVVDTRELALVPVQRKSNKTANLEEVRELRRRLLIRQRFVRGALGFSFALVVSLGVFFFYYSAHRPNLAPTGVARQIKIAAPEVVKPAIKIAPVVEKAVEKTVEKTAPKPAFDPAVSAGETTLHPEAASFAFVNHPRGSGPLAYTTVVPEARAPHVSTLRLRPVPNSDGRFLGSGKVEWQGGWQAHNPQANLSRGQRYLDYLGKRIPGNTGDNLVAAPLPRTR